MANGKCPYYEAYGSCCKLTDTNQDGYHLEAYCLSLSNWPNCANYEAYEF